MKKQLSSVDLCYLAEELQVLKDSRIDKVYQPEKYIIIFSLYKTNVGKKLLKVDIGKTIFIAEEKEDYDEILGFGQLLRKYLDGFFLYEIKQLKPERILKLSFKAKEDKKKLYLEFFGKGNAILCNEHDIIINALEHHEFRERVVKPKLKYVYPVMSYNLFDLKEDDLEKMFKNSKKENIVTSLATELGLGGVYSEEVCLSAKMDKNINPEKTDNSSIKLILNSIKRIISNKIDPYIVLDEKQGFIDVIPFEFEYYKNSQKNTFKTFSEAVSSFFSHFKERKETQFDKTLKSLQYVIEQQKHTIEELRKEEHELRKKGELIYENYSIIKEVLDEIIKASEKFSWKEIKEKIKGHKIIKEVDDKERKIIVDI